MSFCSQGKWQTPPPPGADIPREQTPPGSNTPTPRADTPGADTPQEQTPPGADPPCAVHAGRYGQQAGGTHPTGMHTCYFSLSPSVSIGINGPQNVGAKRLKCFPFQREVCHFLRMISISSPAPSSTWIVLPRL